MTPEDPNEIPPPPSLDEIDARLNAAMDRARAFQPEDADAANAKAARLERLEAEMEMSHREELPDPEESGLDAQLRTVEDRVRGVKDRREKMDAEADRIRKADQASARGLGTGLTAAYALLGLPVAGAGLGYLLDKTTNSSVFLPVFAILGMVAAIWWVVRLTSIQDKK